MFLMVLSLLASTGRPWQHGQGHLMLSVHAACQPMMAMSWQLQQPAAAQRALLLLALVKYENDPC
jgi:hypothetical protein